MALTLKQLKEENAKAEAQAAATPQVEAEEGEAGEAEEEQSLEVEGAETGDEESGKTEVEPWMQSDEEASDTDGHASDEKQFSGKDIAAAKHNLRAKLERKSAKREEELLARIEALEGGKTQQPAAQTGTLAKPKREDFDNAEDPDSSYFEALSDWKLATNMASQDARAQKAARKAQVEQFEQETNQAVDQHYERAVVLAQKSNITDEMYRTADLRVRQIAEDVFPGAGDAIVNSLIATLGEGSEKVMYNLGVNTKRGDKLRDLLKSDQTGLKAATYLGQLNAEIGSPKKRKTDAPAPAPDVKGDQKIVESHKALKRKYDAAHKRGDSQAAFNARRDARKAGADVSNW